MMNTKDKLTDYEMLKKDYLKVTTQNAAMLEALREIEKGEGAYSLDPLKHASNTVNNMKRIATKAIKASR